MSGRRGPSTGLVAVAMAVLLSGCVAAAQEHVGGGDLGFERPKDCRLLGGGWRYLEVRSGDSVMATVEHGPDGGMPSGKRLARTRAKAAANGWDDEAIDILLQLPDDNEMARNVGWEGTDVELAAMRRNVRTRLEAMPRCAE